MSRNTTRRTFLKSAAAATAAFSIIPQNLARSFAANDKINLAIVGVAGQGGVNREWLARLGCNIVALCDPDSKRVDDALKAHPDAQPHADFRLMLEKQKNIDAVMISGPDHMHYPASILAIQLGKHVCTEKPLTHSVWEARQLALAAKKYKVATQHDHENHAVDGLRTLVEWVRSGAIGKVTEVHIWSDRPIWPQGISKRPPTKPVPPNLNWDLWIGPAPFREYHDGLHPFAWRGYWDFGCGALGDMGCHFWDSAVWSLDLFAPSSIQADQQGNSSETGPNWAIITYQFPARSPDLPPCTVKWYDGKKLPPRPDELEPDRQLPTNGSLFVGDKGKILVNDAASPRIIPESKMREYQRPKPFIPRVGDHKIDWLNAIRGGPPAGSDFALFGGPLAEVVLLGNVAIRTGKKLEWDHKNLKATNAPEANQYIQRDYRKGWDFT